MKPKMKCPDCEIPLLSYKDQCSCGFLLGKDIVEQMHLLGNFQRHASAVGHAMTALGDKVTALSQSISETETKIQEKIDEGKTPVFTSQASSPAQTLGHGVENQVKKIKIAECGGEGSTEDELKTEFEDVSIIDASPDLPIKLDTEKHLPSIESQIGEKWLLLTGIVSLIFGFAFFLKYSFDQNWIGPTVRVLMTYSAGVSLLLAGDAFRRRKFEVFGLYLCGGGIATCYFATVAGYQLYHLFGEILAMCAMTAVTACAAWLAVKYDCMWLAVLGIVGGFLTPALLGTIGVDPTGLMSHILFLNLGIFAISFFKQWTMLYRLGFWATEILFSLWFTKYYATDDFFCVTIFLNLFFVIYAIAPIACFYLVKKTGRVHGFVIMFMNSFFALGVNAYMVADKYSNKHVAIITACYALLFYGISRLAGNGSKPQETVKSWMCVKSAFFVAMTIAIYAEQHWVVIGWAVMIAGMLHIASRNGDRRLLNMAKLLSVVAMGRLVCFDYHAVYTYSWTRQVFVDGFAQQGLSRWICMAALLAVACYTAMLAGKKNKEGKNNLSSMAFWFTYVGLCLFIFLNMECCAFCREYFPKANTAMLSILWASYAAGLMAIGVGKRLDVARKSALFLFFITALKVILFDLAHASTPYRVLSFMGLGVLMIGGSYLYHKFGDRFGEVGAL